MIYFQKLFTRVLLTTFIIAISVSGVAYCQDYEINFSSEINYIFSDIDEKFGTDEYNELYERAEDFFDDIEDREDELPSHYVDRAEWIENFAEILIDEQTHIDQEGVNFLNQYLSISSTKLSENKCFTLELWEAENSVKMLSIVNKMPDAIVRFKIRYSLTPDGFTISKGGVGKKEVHVTKVFDSHLADELNIQSVSCSDIYKY